MIKSWFPFAIGIQYLIAAAIDFYGGRPTMAVVWLSYGIAGIALSTI